jgi:hypothetical protein
MSIIRFNGDNVSQSMSSTLGSSVSLLTESDTEQLSSIAAFFDSGDSLGDISEHVVNFVDQQSQLNNNTYVNNGLELLDIEDDDSSSLRM